MTLNDLLPIIDDPFDSQYCEVHGDDLSLIELNPERYEVTDIYADYYTDPYNEYRSYPILCIEVKHIG